MHISHEINCKINVISKRTPLLGQDENWALFSVHVKASSSNASFMKFV